MHDSIAHRGSRATTHVTVREVAQYMQYFVLFVLYYAPYIKNAYYPNLQKYPKARLLFYPY